MLLQRVRRALGYACESMRIMMTPIEQDNLVDAAIASNASAIMILDNAGTDASISAVRRAAKAGIACFLIDREIHASGHRQGADHRRQRQGRASCWRRALPTRWDGKGEYAELLGRESDTNARVRTSRLSQCTRRLSRAEAGRRRRARTGASRRRSSEDGDDPAGAWGF
jgi:erythritol transport system substrate-binding protein